MFDKLNKLFNKPKSQLPDLGWVNVAQGATMKFYGEDDYENSYPYIRFIANRFMKIRPFATDANGKPLRVTPNAINCLARPNQDMSGVDFRDALAVLTSVYDDVFVLVWQRRGRDIIPATDSIREENIAGYTILENAYIDDSGAERVYHNVTKKGKLNTYTTHQVIHFKNTNPKDLSRGYSPVRAVKRWTTVEDYLADYQRSFFENGAVPAGMFTITAPTYQDYKDIVRQMKKKHKGADNQNGVLYSYSPLDPSTQKPTQANISWISFNVQNKDLSLNELFTQADTKIQRAWGVHPYLIGDAKSAPNRSVAQSIERLAVENVIEPFTMKLWSRFQHELNRITGGLGYNIAYKIEIPNISEDEESKARADTLRVTALMTLTSMGYDLETSVDALELPNNWKALKKGVQPAVITNDKPEVDEGEEVESAPKAHMHNCSCHHCGDGVMEAKGQVTATEYQQQFEDVASRLMQAQINIAKGELKDDDLETQFIDEMMVVVSTVLLNEGTAQWNQGLLLLMSHGIVVPTASYVVTAEALTRYRDYLKDELFLSYSGDTSARIQDVLLKGKADGLTRTELEKNLQEIMQTDKWRVTRIGVSETNKSMSQASVEAMIALEDDTDATVEKSMISSTGNPCEFCATLIGKWFPVRDIMVKKGEVIVASDGSVFVNNWDNNIGHDLHANGKCTPTYRVKT